MTRRPAATSAAAHPQFTTSPPASAAATRTLAVTSYYDIDSGTTLVTDVAPDAGAPTPTHPNATYTLSSARRIGPGGGERRHDRASDPRRPRRRQPCSEPDPDPGKGPRDQVREIDVLQDGRPIEEDHASPHEPTVKLLSPSAGRTIGGPGGAVIRWHAQEIGGGALEVTVEYSADSSRSYRPIYTGPNDGSVLLPSYLLSASHDAPVRLYASDGFNEAIITSPRFIARGAPPMVHITSPTTAIKIPAGATVNLAGTAYDDQGAMLSGRALVWRSGRQILGHGTHITTTALPAGRHRVTLTARDPGGRTTSESVSVTILNSPPVLTALGFPSRISPTTRSLTLRVATLVPDTLTIGRAHVAVNRRPKQIHLRIKASRRALQLELVLRSGRYSQRIPITITR